MGNTPTRTLTDAFRATPASPTSKCAFDMKICSACTLELPKQRFNNKQWPLELNQRRCTTCIADERVAELTTPECWICFQDEFDKSECLRRDCSCRGPDAGFVHLSCLVRYSEKKNIDWDGRDPDVRLFNDFVKPWEVCPNCRQRYQNTLKADIANEFVSSVERKHPNDQQKKVEALVLELTALYNSQQPTQINEAKVVATRVLVLIRDMKIKTTMPPERWTQLEAYTYFVLGVIVSKEETEGSDQEALVHLGKSLELSRAINFARGMASAEHSISLVKSKLERCTGRNKEDELMKLQAVHDLNVRNYGEENELTISSGLNLAIALWKAKRGVEAERLSMRVADLSERIHGPQHNTTKRAKSWLNKINAPRAKTAEWRLS